MVDKYDAILSKILEEGLTEYFDIIYSFLYRKLVLQINIIIIFTK